MKVLCVFVIITLVISCRAAPQQNEVNEDDSKIELFSGIAIQRDPSGTDTLNVKFNPGELQEAAKTFEEGRAKIKKYSPLVAGLGVKALAVIGIIFGALTLLVTKAIFVAKIAFFVAAALGLQRWLATGGQFPIIGKLTGEPTPWATGQPQWTAAASNTVASYPYARSSDGLQGDANDLAYRGQAPAEGKDK